ncbi:unnamed protein product [Cylicostephanus goldi]|uniref:Uncharacterized protein n=1 Tax=Cylicostephanus goldi TaxID=71465 RepID=A0A3P7MNI6_CYLGO|nr:unnamed protein product [Cylicostephanus goldi]
MCRKPSRITKKKEQNRIMTRSCCQMMSISVALSSITAKRRCIERLRNV